MNETQSQQHTGSYYAATVNQPTQYASLKGEQIADVCIIGAGFTGVSTALHLAERGYKVQERDGENSGLHIIVVRPDTLDGAADKRREGIVRTTSVN